MKKFLLLLLMIVTFGCQKDFYLDELNAAEAEIAQLNSISEAQQSEIRDLKEIIETVNRDIENAQNHIVVLDSLLVEANQEIKLLDIDIERLVGLVEDRQAALDTLTQQSELDKESIATLSEEIASLEAALAQAETLAQNQANRITELENVEPTVITVVRTRTVTVQGPAVPGPTEYVAISYVGFNITFPSPAGAGAHAISNSGLLRINANAPSFTITGESARIRITADNNLYYGTLTIDTTPNVGVWYNFQITNPSGFPVADNTGLINPPVSYLESTVEAWSFAYDSRDAAAIQGSTPNESGNVNYNNDPVDCASGGSANLNANETAVNFSVNKSTSATCSGTLGIEVLRGNDIIASNANHFAVAVGTASLTSGETLTLRATGISAYTTTVTLETWTESNSGNSSDTGVANSCDGITATPSFNSDNQWVVTLNVPQGCSITHNRVGTYHPSSGNSSIVDPTYLTDGESLTVKAYNGSTDDEANVVWTGTVTYVAQVVECEYTPSTSSSVGNWITVSEGTHNVSSSQQTVDRIESQTTTTTTSYAASDPSCLEIPEDVVSSNTVTRTVTILNSNYTPSALSENPTLSFTSVDIVGLAGTAISISGAQGEFDRWEILYHPATGGSAHRARNNASDPHVTSNVNIAEDGTTTAVITFYKTVTTSGGTVDVPLNSDGNPITFNLSRGN